MINETEGLGQTGLTMQKAARIMYIFGVLGYYFFLKQLVCGHGSKLSQRRDHKS